MGNERGAPVNGPSPHARPSGRFWRHLPLLTFAGLIVLALLPFGRMQPASAAPAALPTKAPQPGRRPAIALPDGFQDVIVLDGLDHPTDFQFSPDGRLFVAEKAGQVKIFAGLNVPNPDLILSLDAEVNSYMDRGLMSLALDPDFPANPYLYLLYTYDAPPGQAAPVWNDTCPDPPGGLTNGCVVRGRLTRVQVD